MVYEDVIDAKQACDKLNGFNFQNRYLVGTSSPLSPSLHKERSDVPCISLRVANNVIHSVLYHQPEKMAKSKEDLAERQENLEKLKRQHGID